MKHRPALVALVATVLALSGAATLNSTMASAASTAAPACLETTYTYNQMLVTPSNPPSATILVQEFQDPDPVTNPEELYYETWHIAALPGYTLQSVTVDAGGFVPGSPELTQPDGQTLPGYGVFFISVFACPEQGSTTSSSTTSSTVVDTTSTSTIVVAPTSTAKAPVTPPPPPPPPPAPPVVKPTHVDPAFTG